MRPAISPPRAVKMTTNQGGNFQNIKRLKATSPRPKSAGAWIALVHTGLYSAVSSKPTTAALMPFKADWKTGTARSRSQKGSAPTTRRNDGRNIATRVSHAPVQPWGSGPIIAPRYAENVNNGPGTAWVAP